MTSSHRILFLEPPQGVSQGYRAVISQLCRQVDINPAGIIYINLRHKIPQVYEWVMKNGKRVQIIRTENYPIVREALGHYIKLIPPDIIVCNDSSILGMLTDVKDPSLNKCRGGVYSGPNGIPIFILDDISLTNKAKHMPWVFINDFEKLSRHLSGKTRKQPRFWWRLTETVEDVLELERQLAGVDFISEDIETKGATITCISLTAQLASGVKSFVIPFVNPLKPNGSHWESDEDETAVWAAIRRIHDSPAIKIMQNGMSYDIMYFIIYHCPMRNLLLDTMHLFHSVWAEAPKTINFISSIVLDHYQYWKDDAKGSKEDNFGTTRESLEIYWRYAALDAYYAYCCAPSLTQIVAKLPWAVKNYHREILLQLGPCLAMAGRGMAIDKDRFEFKKNYYEQEAVAAEEELKVMTDFEQFNPNANEQVQTLIYDVLRADPVKTPGNRNRKTNRPVDENTLKLIRTQHPFYNVFIEAIWRCKKARNNLSKYFYKYYPNWRFLYQYGAGMTETSRFNGTNHQTWVGTNPQNIPTGIRDMFIADQGKMLWECDYTASDAVFIAYESQDEQFIENVSGNKDVHCLHAAYFFKLDYEEIIHGVKNKIPFFADHNTGLRALTKRITHGTNFRMQAFTMWFHLVKNDPQAVIHAAKVLGFANSFNWSIKQQIDFVEKHLLHGYYELYPRLKTWYDETIQECIKNGNKITNYFGFTRQFFGNIANDPAVQRELSSNYGQAGTAGNINRSLIEIYWDSREFDERVELLTQTHDSIGFQTAIGDFEAGRKVLTIMRKKVKIHDREFNVNVEPKIGFSWGKGLKVWDEKTENMQEFYEHEMALNSEYQQASLEAAE